MTDTQESELVKRLRDTAREILDWHGDTMHNWDLWREAIATGEKASWPRDAFEALMEDHAEKMREAASTISRYEAALRRAEFAMWAIKRLGELNVVQLPDFYANGGKKPPSKEVFQFPRYLLTDLDDALATIRAALESKNG